MLSKRQDIPLARESSDQPMRTLRPELPPQEEATEQSIVLDIVSHSLAQTQRLGARLGELLHGGELLLLNGDLGTGKTAFTQGIAEGLLIRETVNSPTFTLLKEYEGRLSLYHFDLYRLDDPAEMFDLGFEDYFSGKGVCVVEWANKAEGAWPDEQLTINFKVVTDTKRGLVLTGNGPRYGDLLLEFRKSAFGIGA